jgi:hypothetical protein
MSYLIVLCVRCTKYVKWTHNVEIMFVHLSTCLFSHMFHLQNYSTVRSQWASSWIYEISQRRVITKKNNILTFVQCVSVYWDKGKSCLSLQCGELWNTTSRPFHTSYNIVGIHEAQILENELKRFSISTQVFIFHPRTSIVFLPLLLLWAWDYIKRDWNCICLNGR